MGSIEICSTQATIMFTESSSSLLANAGGYVAAAGKAACDTNIKITAVCGGPGRSLRRKYGFSLAAIVAQV
jgi:hypothetical protein